MITLNLDPNFIPFKGTKTIPFEKLDFPSGSEPHIKILPDDYEEVVITTRIQSSNDLMRLLLATDALRRLRVEKISAFIPFLPFARQDRVMVPGEPFSLKVLARILNDQNYDFITLFDPHSEVSPALLDKVHVSTNHSFVEHVLKDKTNYLIVSPDAGAYKKIFSLCQYLKYKDEIVLSNKTRDVTTGTITSVTCPVEDFQGKDLYIVDDICDGGWTFVMLAKELRNRNCGKIYLIVSHGIFSKGIDALVGIDHIYTTNSVKDIPAHEKLTQISL